MKRTEKILTLSSSALVGTLLLTGCGGGSNPPADPAPAESTASVAENESTAGATTDPSASESPTTGESASSSASASDEAGSEAASLAAVETVLAKYQGADVVELDYDQRDNDFEADVIQDDSKHEVTVDGSGRNITQERADGTADQDDLDELNRASISIDEAIKRAFQEASSQNGTVMLDEVSLDEDNGILHWEVELDIADRDVTYYVDAVQGSVRSEN